MPGRLQPSLPLPGMKTQRRRLRSSSALKTAKRTRSRTNGGPTRSRGLSPASVNRSMSAINSLVAYARRVGITKLRLEAKGVKSKSYRDTRGPGVRGVQSMLAIARDQGHEKTARDAAIIRLAYGLGLRRGEIESLNIVHLDVAAGTLHVLGKGRTEREPMTLPLNTKQALDAWLSVRGIEDGNAPLFIALDRNTCGERLSGSGICATLTRI
jgi:integrase/recombinase XerC